MSGGAVSVSEGDTPEPDRTVKGDDHGHGDGGPILETVGVTKQFGGLTAVNDVSFAIPPRSIVSIIGPNGAGKTTFFNMLTGLYKPTHGRIAFAGEDITAGRPDKIMALGVARTFQNIRLFGTMTAVENVMVGQHARMHAGLFGSILRTPGVRKEEKLVRERAVEMLEFVGLRRTRTTSSRRTCPTATSAAWRSRARWRPSRRCSCSTSRRRA
jgi:ABC-type branched-subunit amino acid transport system ATPase component